MLQVRAWELKSKSVEINLISNITVLSQPLSAHLYSYLLLVNLVMKSSYLNPNFCSIVVVVAMCII